MRLKSLAAVAAAILALGGASPDKAEAFGARRDSNNWARPKVVHHWVYRPQYVHYYHRDPYAYQYSPRGYYPYYNSGYWRPASEIRARNRAHYHKWNTQPPRFKYYKSWGGPRQWNHRQWHDENHGRHRLHHW
ncbi:MAG: hypothetical protein R3D68_10090 [Hyphomicrobiaceae bacterium]